jgi:hypothetical protein
VAQFRIAIENVTKTGPERQHLPLPSYIFLQKEQEILPAFFVLFWFGWFGLQC